MILPVILLFGLKREEVTGDRENCVMWSFMICALHQMLRYLELSDQAYGTVWETMNA
jgi:hypothetical protein